MICIDWDEYLQAPDMDVAEQRTAYADIASSQKNNIKQLCEKLQPQTVLCLGAGYLSTIPVDSLIAVGADIYCVDWVKGPAEKAFRHGMVKSCGSGYSCIVCVSKSNPAKYCGKYDFTQGNPCLFGGSRNHCDNFSLKGEYQSAECANYIPSEFPRFLHADVTQGVAENFARAIPAILKHAKEPRHAFQLALRACDTMKVAEPLPLPDNTMELITSSMLVSQFDFEPYTYFIRSLIQHYGQDRIDKDIDYLDSLEETLRNALFIWQVEGLCREMIRLISPNGRVYLSMEKFHRESMNNWWFKTETSLKAMEIIQQYFYFDMETLPSINTPSRAFTPDGDESIIHSYLIYPKPVYSC